MRNLLHAFALTVVTATLSTSCDLNDDVSGSDGDKAPAVAMRITPSSTVAKNGATVVVLTLVGGNAPFTATVSDATLGSITPTNTTARAFNYRPTPPVKGVNTIRITDRHGNAATATVVHEDT